MMNKTILSIILLFISFTIKAQNIPYEKLDSISELISKRQFEANDKSYIENEKTIKVSFSNQNFKVAFSDLLTTNVVYKMTNNLEVMELAENIDLTKVKSVKINTLDTYLYQYVLEFPANSIALQIYENENFKETQNVSEISVCLQTKVDFS